MELHSSCQVKLEACMCVLNMYAPQDCVCLELLYSRWCYRLVSHEPRGTQRSSTFIFLAVRLLAEWEVCDNGGLINPTKTTPTLQYLIYPHKRTQFSVSWRGVCVSILRRSGRLRRWKNFRLECFDKSCMGMKPQYSFVTGRRNMPTRTCFVCLICVQAKI